MWSFLCDSDLHYGATGARKPGMAQKIISYRPADFLINCGDLTDNGADGAGLCCQNPYPDELQAFTEDYLNPIERSGLPVYLCPGNHDVNKSQYPWIKILQLIRDKYQATYNWMTPKYSGMYSFDHKGIRFISLGEYPCDPDFLASVLPKDATTPIIIFYHFNTIKGQPWSDWWTDDQKATFYEAIKSKNVLAILNGHFHTTQVNEWNGITNILCAQQAVRVSINGNKISHIEILS